MTEPAGRDVGEDATAVGAAPDGVPGGRGARARAGIAALRAEAETGALPRHLARRDLVGLGVGAMIGGGVFVMTGLVAGHDAGPAVVLSYLVAGLVCGVAALCYAELAALMPVAGGAYAYARATLGDAAGWLVGWLLLVEYALGAALVAVGWAGYLLGLLGGLAPAGAGAHENLLAAGLVLLAGGLLALGIRPSAYANGVLVLVKVAAIVLFIGFGAAFIEPAHWRPFVPSAAGAQFGWGGVARAAALVFFAYVGFDAIAAAAQEARAPGRDLPAAILGSLGVTGLLYMAVALVLTGLVPYATLGTASIGAALAAAGLGWLRTVVDVAILAGLTSVLLVLLLAQARIAFAMARDGLLPAAFARVHPRLRSPWAATAATAALVAAAAVTLPLRAIGELVSVAVLVTYGGVCVGVVLLRRAAPAAPRPFRVPASPVLPVLGALACLALLLALPRASWLQLAIWLAGGLALYAARQGVRRVHAKPDPRVL